MTAGGPLVLVGSGMRFEAAIACGDDVHACCGQGEHLVAALADAPRARCAGVLSFGIAAGLDPALGVGSIVIASDVKDRRGDVFQADAHWRSTLAQQCMPVAEGMILGSVEPVAEVSRKAELFAATGAVALDMETHILAHFARRHGLRFAALRVICDPADQAIPPVALRGLRTDGSSDAAAVVKGLARTPLAAGPLLRAAAATARAHRTLVRARRLLGPGFGLVNLV